MGTDDTTSKRPAKPTVGERSRTAKLPNKELITPTEASGQLPAKADQKPRAEVYRPHTPQSAQRTRQAQRYEMRRFAHGGPMALFHTVADYIDMAVRPTFAAITFAVNFLLQWIWYLVQGVGGLVSDDARNTLRRAAPPTLRPGSPAATVVSVIVVLFVASSLARPFLWPDHPEPRAFGGGRGNPSNMLKAVNPWQQLRDAVVGAINGASQSAPVAEQPPLAARQPGDHDVRGAPTISADHIDQILSSYNSPATGSGAAWVAMGQKYGIDPAYAVAFFVHESGAGTAQGWAGWKPDGSSTHNVGNIICAGYSTCYGRFRDYPSWEAGIDDWYKLIAVEYIEGRGTTTVDTILPIYAPTSENDTEGYIRIVEQMVDGWRSGKV